MAYECVFTKDSLKNIAEKKYSEGYRLAYYDKETQIGLWDREVKKKYKRTDTFPEFIEFINMYKNLKKGINGLSDPKLPGIYKNILKEFKHQDILNNLKQYKMHLESFSYKKPTMPQTYLNQHRFKEKWELDKHYFANKWRQEMLDEQKVPKEVQEPIKAEAKVWIEAHKDKEITRVIFQNMIDKYFIPKNYK